MNGLEFEPQGPRGPEGPPGDSGFDGIDPLWAAMPSRDQTNGASLDIAVQFIQQFFRETPFVRVGEPR